MSTNEYNLLMEFIKDRLDRLDDRLDKIEDKINEHIAQEKPSNALELVKPFGPWVLALVMALSMVFGGSSKAPAAPASEKWQAVASSTLVVHKRLVDPSPTTSEATK